MFYRIFIVFWLLIAPVSEHEKVYPSALKQITHGNCKFSHPFFVPGNQNIFFDVLCDGKISICCSSPDSFLLVKSVFDTASVRQGTYDPVRKRLIGTKNEKQISRLVFENTDNQIKSFLKRDIQSKEADIYPASNLMVFAGKSSTDYFWRIYTYDFKYDNLNHFDEPQAECSYPRWSAKGEWISYTTSEKGRNRKFIRVMHWYGKEFARITDSILSLSDACWSPTGNKIVFTAEDVDSSYLFMSQKDGSNREKLLSSPWKILSPDWSPDGRMIAFSVEMPDNSSHIFGLYPDELTSPISLSLQPE
jgi:Tol biopolymer transport system component